MASGAIMKKSKTDFTEAKLRLLATLIFVPVSAILVSLMLAGFLPGNRIDRFSMGLLSFPITAAIVFFSLWLSGRAKLLVGVNLLLCISSIVALYFKLNPDAF